MNLAVDIGNTRVKAGLFNAKELVEVRYFKNPLALLEDPFIQQASQAIIGTVVNGQDEFYNALKQQLPVHLFTTETRIPLKNLYRSSSTLGSDRLAASIAAYFLYPNTNVLVIDAGTCIKYNFTNSENHYLGGAISPGIPMRLKSMHHFTSRLPLVETDFSFTELTGNTTQNSLLSGAINGAAAEIDGFIDRYTEQFPGTICVLTGGDSQYLADRLKNSIFVHQNLVLKGLNDILNYNSEQA